MQTKDKQEEVSTKGEGFGSEPLTLDPIKGLQGEGLVPGDKSISHRALILSVLSRDPVRIQNLSPGEDVRSTRRCLEQVGATITREDEAASWQCSRGAFPREPLDVLDAGNSGTTFRLLAGLLSSQPLFTVLTGDASLRKRPMDRIAVPLRQMGAEIWGREGGRYPPVAIRGGPLQPIHYPSPVASAQVKTAILLAGLSIPEETSVTEPYTSRDHTERMLRYMGADIHCSERKVSIRGGKGLQARELFVPGDPSSAAFLLVAALVTRQSDLQVRQVCVNPTRIGFLEILQRMGASVRMGPVREVNGEPVADIHVSSSRLNGTTIRPDEIPACIDEIPILCVAAAFAQGMTRIEGAAELRVKESDRIAAVASNLSRMGISVQEKPDGLEIQGRGKVDPFEGESWHDHRIALSLVVAALASQGTCRIHGASSMNISFPGFLDFLNPLLLK